MAKPIKLGEILAELILRRGYAREQSQANFTELWKSAAGEMLAKYSRVGQVKRGTLEVVVANSALVQELTFRKSELIDKLRQGLPNEKINDLRFRVGPLS
jgi:predicted nucleic acid-binding Zn ribbon protein